MLAPDAEELVIAYLSQSFDNVSFIMPDTPPMPFYLVHRISGGSDKVTDHATVSIHAFHSTRSAAADAAREMHDLMTNWLPKTAVALSSGSAGVDHVYVLETPAWVDYDDKTLQRYVGRYRIDLRLK